MSHLLLDQFPSFSFHWEEETEETDEDTNKEGLSSSSNHRKQSLRTKIQEMTMNKEERRKLQKKLKMTTLEERKLRVKRRREDECNVMMCRLECYYARMCSVELLSLYTLINTELYSEKREKREKR